jgi:hypothetical protein
MKENIKKIKRPRKIRVNKPIQITPNLIQYIETDTPINGYEIKP